MSLPMKSERLDPPFGDPTGHESFLLPEGEAVGVPVYRPHFDAATERIRFDNDLYDIKPQLVLEGEVLLAELLIVRQLERSGWEAVWIDNFKNKHWRELPVHGAPTLLPEHLEAMLRRITERNGRRAGAFDVLAWKGPTIAFLESKGPDDSISAAQRSWFVAAVDAGVPLGAFGIVEWDYVDPGLATRGQLRGRRRKVLHRGPSDRAKGASESRQSSAGAVTPTGGSDALPAGAGPREIALADRLPPVVVRSVTRAGYTLCAAQALDSDGVAYPSRIRNYVKPEGGLNAQGRAARDEIRALGFKI